MSLIKSQNIIGPFEFHIIGLYEDIVYRPLQAEIRLEPFVRRASLSVGLQFVIISIKMLWYTN